jgi:hypothetical protein
MTSLITNTLDSISIQILPTKPDPTAPCTPKNLFSRPAIKRSVQKGDTAIFYALYLLLPRIGKKPCPTLKKARTLETLVSSIRKSLTIESVLWGKSPLYKDRMIWALILQIAKVAEFLKQPSPEIAHDYTEGFKTLERLIYNNLYEMLPSKWNPEDEILSLIGSLRDFGPIIINLKSKDLYKNIVVTGADLTSGIVHFLDPADGAKLVHAIAYELFRESVLGSGWQAPFIS